MPMNLEVMERTIKLRNGNGASVTVERGYSPTVTVL
jgi:hypothetical protein